MGNKNFLSIIVEILQALFGSGKSKPSPNNPPPLPDSDTEPAAMVTSRVLLLVYDPVVDPVTGQRLSQKLNWHHVDELISGFNADIREASGGLARFEVVQRVDVDEFPVKADGFRYTTESYLAVLRGKIPAHLPDTVDYNDILAKFNILQRVSNQEIDEVWVFAFPYGGFWESTMGGAGAFWCNSHPMKGTASCPRRFVVMGLSYERGVGEMLESFGHRSESIMDKTFSRLRGDANLYQKFTRYGKITPGRAEIGTIHFAPNSEKDYDWGNVKTVTSYCDDWYNFPNFKGTARQVNCSEWGNGDIRAHHVWWLKHLPKVAGRRNGIANNWWQYILDPNRVMI